MLEKLSPVTAAASVISAIIIHLNRVNTHEIFCNFKTFHIFESLQATIL